MKTLDLMSVRQHLEDLKVHPENVFIGSDSVKADGYKAIVFDRDDTLIKIASNKYKIFQHIEAFDRGISELEELGVRYNLIKQDFNVENGRNSMKLTFAFPDMSFDVDGSQITATYELINSTDLTCCFTRLFGAFRLVCSNGMIIGKKFFTSSKRHIGQFDIQSKEQVVEQMKNGFEGLKDILTRAQITKINENLLKSIGNLGFPEKILNNLPEYFTKYAESHNEQIQDYNSVWALYAILTNYLSNVVVNTNIRRYMDMQSGLFNRISQFVA